MKRNAGSTIQSSWGVQTNQSHKGKENKNVHQQEFDNVKATIVKDVTLAYPDYMQGFEVYTTALSYS